MPLSIGPAGHTPTAPGPRVGTHTLALGPALAPRFAGGPQVGDFVAGDAPITAATVDVTDPSVDLAALTLVKANWTDPPCDAGAGSITLANDDSALADISEGSAVRLDLKGAPAVVLICETVDAAVQPKAQVGQGEAAQALTTWRGRLYPSLMDRAVVFPSQGTGRRPIQEDRVMDYSEASYDASGWVLPVTFGNVETVRYFYWYSIQPGAFLRLFAETPDDLAKDFPDPFASTVGPPGATILRARPSGDSGGDWYMRWVVFAPRFETYTLCVLSDDSSYWALDGVPQTSTAANLLQTARVDIEITPGFHVLSAHINNRHNAEVAWELNPSGEFNASMCAWSLFYAGQVNTSGFVDHSTATNGLTSGWQDRAPGMTIGKDLRVLMEEAEARGVSMPARGFTDTHDSAGQLMPLVSAGTRVGTDYLSVLREWSVGYIDWAFRRRSYTLDIWNRQGMGQTRAITMTPPTNPRLPTSGTTAALNRKGER